MSAQAFFWMVVIVSLVLIALRVPRPVIVCVLASLCVGVQVVLGGISMSFG